MKSLGIIGCGWLGTRIGQHFSNHYKIYATCRTTERAESLKKFEVGLADFSNKTAFNSEFNNCDFLVISASYPTENSIEWLENLKKFIGEYHKPIVFFSSTSIYPNKEKTFTEENTSILELNSRIYTLESELKKHFKQILILRLGGLMGDDRYLSKYYTNKPLHQAGTRVNYIHYCDIIGVLELVFNNGIKGEIYNLVAPEHPRKSDVFYAQTKQIEEGEDYNRIVSSEKLIKEMGYTFVYPNPILFPYNEITSL